MEMGAGQLGQWLLKFFDHSLQLEMPLMSTHTHLKLVSHWMCAMHSDILLCSILVFKERPTSLLS